MKALSIEVVENGFMVRVNSSIYVFQSSADLGEFIMDWGDGDIKKPEDIDPNPLAHCK